MYDALIDTANDVIIGIDLEGKIIYCNAALTKEYRWEKNEIVGKNFSLLLPESELHSFETIKEKILFKEEQKYFDSRRVTKNHNIVLISVNYSPILDPSGKVIGISSIERILPEKIKVQRKAEAIVETAPDGIIVVNKFGQIVLVNAQTIKLFRYDREELIGQPIELLIPQRFNDVHEHHREGFFKAPKVREMGQGLELFGKRKDNSEFPVEISLSPFIVEDTTYVSAAVRDVTERKKAEKKFKDLLESAPDATVIVDNRGVIQLINSQAERLFGYTRNEMINQSVEILIPDHFKKIHESHRNSYFQEPKVRGMGVGLELFGKMKSGKQFPVEISLSPLETEEGILVSAAIRDITDRKSVETKLRESEQRFRTLVDNAMISIVTAEEDGTILSFNKASCDIFGYSSEFIIGKNVRMLVSLQEAEELKISKELVENYYEIRCKRMNGEIFPAEISISLMNIEGNANFIFITRDITEREKLSKMKNEFISTVSHELRTPLTSIHGAIGLILGGRGGEVYPLTKQLLEIAYRNSERLIALVNDILTIEKIESGKIICNLETIDLVELIPAVVELNRLYADKFDVNLILDQPFNTFKVVTDQRLLTQVITILLSNAIKFSPKGETVVVKLEKKGSIVRISVIDHGPGIPKDFHPKLFQKFMQLDSSDIRQKGGTGLGLSIAKMIMQTLEGNIGFNSVEGEGSTFYLDIKELRE